jgi:hypothetical protein
MLKQRVVHKAGVLRVLLVTMAVSAGVAVAYPSAAMAADEYALESFSTSVVAEDGSDETRAGAHPFGASTEIRFETVPRPSPAEPDQRGPAEEPRDVQVRLPAGFVGNPQTAGRCELHEVKTGTFPSERSPCPLDAAVGHMVIEGNVSLSQPIFSVVPERGYPAQFAFSHQALTFVLYPELRSDGDYGIDVSSVKSPANMIAEIRAEFCSWGVVETSPPGSGEPTYECRKRADAPSDARPFLTMSSTECPAEPPVTMLRVNSWANSGRYLESQFASPLLTDCDTMQFVPSVDIEPTTTLPDAPTGLDVDMTFPQDDNDQGQAPPALKKAVVTLPEGMSINPSAAGGLTACADDELMLKSKAPTRCPEASKIGQVTAVSPLLDEPVKGGVYIRSQNSSDPESGEMFRLALVLENKDRGISIRLPGQVRVNEDTGRIETTFDNNPELPVSSIKLTLKDGPRAPLATPPTCGPKSIDTVLTSWGGQTIERSSTFNVDCTAGLGGFAPSFEAGAVNPIAGTFSPFALSIAKPDRDSALDGVSLKMPTGLLARIKGNLNTQVGSVKAFAGPGSQPFMLPGTVTLEGAYGDAPYSLRVVVPAKAGPFDLGDVVVRQKVYVHPVTAEVTVVSDPVPTIVKGVPARMQRLDVNVDKPGFMVNPTSCEAKEITGTLDSLAGQTAAVRSRFQVGECAALPFNPRLAMRLTGRKQVSTGKHPGVRALVRQTGVGEAGILKAKVTLPKSLALDPENAQALCEFEDGTKPDLEKHCPAGSIVGRARATTPLLERDLTGNVYFVKNVRKDPKTGNTIRTLPMLVVALRGEISINLKGESSTTKAGRLVNTFNNVPDAPISKFNLNIAGGQNGILAVTRTRQSKINVCAGRQTAQADMNGQNGRRHDFDVQMKTPCSKRQTKAAKRQAKRAAAKARH